MIHLGDITQIYGHNIPPVDVITFGSPCQDLSVAGKRAGLGGERSGLFSETIRIIQEMRDATNGKHPAFAVWENVPGAYSSNRGEDFRNVLQGLVSLCGDTIPIPGPAGRWLTAGEIMGDNYSIAWRTMDAQYWGVPQRRRRIALVVDFGGGRASKILFDAESLPGDPQPGKSEKKGAPRNSGSGINMAEGSLCGGFKGRVSAGQVCHVVYDARGNGSGGVCPTITGDHQNRVTDYTAICVQGNIIDREANCNGAGWRKDICYTLNTIDRHGVMCIMGSQKNANINNDLCGTLTCMHEQPYIFQNCIHAINTGYIVRRLTPLECERLQGFPDGWTDIGSWTDNKGRLHKECSDSARYKALGNSIALPQWEWLMGRMARYLPDKATLGSLFDGIGGFPLVWERIHGQGSALWASEVEPFPIAVTTVRFGGQDDG